MCQHHWVLEGSDKKARGVCRECEEKKVFNGGEPDYGNNMYVGRDEEKAIYNDARSLAFLRYGVR